jgi:hypothetical protein
LLKSSKFHLTFRDIDDIEDFFKGMGLAEIAEDQPTFVEIAQELSLEFEFFNWKTK